MKEVELLFRIDEQTAEKLREKLKDFFITKKREVDTYFHPPHRDFVFNENGLENLRLRRSVSKNELTYKNVIYKMGKYSHSIEKNVNISEPDKIEEILKSLGFRTHMIVDKEREIFDSSSFHITLDKVKGLGTFVEVEWKGDADSEEKVMQKCAEFAEKLGLKNRQEKGYLRMLEENI